MCIENEHKEEVWFNRPAKLMRFRLTYDGPLRTSKNDSRTLDKNNIRRCVHSQLCVLFSTHPTLIGWLSPNCDKVEVAKNILPMFGVPDGHGGNLIQCMPLISKNLFMTCDLDVLFLRKEEPGRLIGNNGDMDNRLLTLFDGLRMPQTVEELDLGKPYPQPFMLCLLEDDRLITGVNVRTDRLLAPIPDAHPDDVRLVIDVTVNVRTYVYATIGFIAD